MDRFQKVNLVLILIILALNILFFIYVFNFGGISGFVLAGGSSLKTPSSFISDKNITADKDKVIISVENPILTKYKDSGSMVPVLDRGTTGINVKPKTEDDIHIGDIISFRQGGNIIVHRVIEKGVDSFGVYFITKGDNNNLDDGKIRFEEVDSILVGLVY
jgi:signal peptidase I